MSRDIGTFYKVNKKNISIINIYFLQICFRNDFLDTAEHLEYLESWYRNVKDKYEL